jgi:hypothetical protein
MTADQYTELIDFLAEKFGRIDERFDAVEDRLTRLEVEVEVLRHDLKAVTEGVSMTNERLDRYHQDHEIRIQALESRWFRN